MVSDGFREVVGMMNLGWSKLVVQGVSLRVAEGEG